MTPLLNDLDF